MFAKIVLVLFLLAIIAALFSGLFFLLKDRSTVDNRRAVKALTWRVGLQLGLIAFLVLCWYMGWLQPHGVGG